jgi:hypothetical protein
MAQEMAASAQQVTASMNEIAISIRNVSGDTGGLRGFGGRDFSGHRTDDALHSERCGQFCDLTCVGGADVCFNQRNCRCRSNRSVP